MQEIDIVTLLEQPTRENGYFYVVEGKAGKYYVSSLFGVAAKGLTTGTQFKLHRTNPHKDISAYQLTRL
jgi:hypothetical protein